MNTVPVGKFYGGTASYNMSSLPVLTRIFSTFVRQEIYDDYSQLNLLYGWYQNTSIVMTHQHYTKHERFPEKLFFGLDQYQTKTSFRFDSMSGFAKELESIPSSQPVRKAFATLTTLNNVEMLNSFRDLANNTHESILTVKGLEFIVSLQGFGSYITAKAANTGGNLFNLPAIKETRVVYCLTVSWTNEEDDTKVDSAIQALIKTATGKARALNVLDDFLFINYAAPWQDVTSRTFDKQARILQKRTSKRYDPYQIFQNAVPGGFKLTK